MCAPGSLLGGVVGERYSADLPPELSLNNPEDRRCRTCGEMKPLRDFSMTHQKPSGTDTECRGCRMFRDVCTDHGYLHPALLSYPYGPADPLYIRTPHAGMLKGQRPETVTADPSKEGPWIAQLARATGGLCEVKLPDKGRVDVC